MSIEDLLPGDWILGHDAVPRRILRIECVPYRGVMIGIRRAGVPDTLWLTAGHEVLCHQRILNYGLDRPWGAVPPDHFGRARELRRKATPEESRLWEYLRRKQLGVKFRFQHPLGRYLADFYARDPALVVELDGTVHFTPEARAHDEERTAYLESLGLDVVRFDNAEVWSMLERVLARIKREARRVRPADQLLQQWRRADTLRPGDVVYWGATRAPAEVVSIEREEIEEDVLSVYVDSDGSLLTVACAIAACAG